MKQTFYPHRTLADLPHSINALIRLGAEAPFRGLALPVYGQGKGLTGFDLWVCNISASSIGAFSIGGTRGYTRYQLTPTELVASNVGARLLRRWQQKITGMTSRRAVEGTKPMFRIWRLTEDYGGEVPKVLRVDADHRLVEVVWEYGTRWCTVSPINPAVRRAGL